MMSTHSLPPVPPIGRGRDPRVLGTDWTEGIAALDNLRRRTDPFVAVTKALIEWAIGDKFGHGDVVAFGVGKVGVPGPGDVDGGRRGVFDGGTCHLVATREDQDEKSDECFHGRKCSTRVFDRGKM